MLQFIFHRKCRSQITFVRVKSENLNTQLGYLLVVMAQDNRQVKGAGGEAWQHSRWHRGYTNAFLNTPSSCVINIIGLRGASYPKGVSVGV